MDKAIEILEQLKDYPYWTCRHNIDQALDEPTAHKAKIESLEKWCKEQKLISGHGGKSDFKEGKEFAYFTVLQKLEELDK